MRKESPSLLDYLRKMSGALHLDYLSGTRNMAPDKAKRLLKRLKELYPNLIFPTEMIDEDYPYKYCLKIPLQPYGTGKHKSFLAKQCFSLYLCPFYKNSAQVAFRINPFYLKFIDLIKFSDGFKQITGKNLNTLFNGANITELHFAIDIKNIHFNDIIVWYKYQKTPPKIMRNGKYYGSRFSQIMLVVYSKSEEQRKKKIQKSSNDFEVSLSSEFTRVELRWRCKNGGSYPKYNFRSLTEFYFPFEKMFITDIERLKSKGDLSSEMIENLLRFGVQDTFSKFPKQRKMLSLLIIENCHFNEMREELTEQLHSELRNLIRKFR